MSMLPIRRSPSIVTICVAACFMLAAVVSRQAFAARTFDAIRDGIESLVHTVRPDFYPEVGELARKRSQLSYGFLSEYFRELARRKGGEYAFEVLKRISAPPGVDFHLLGHAVGDELYKQKGIAGMASCTSDFRNACSHSIVVGFLYDHGEKAFPEIAAACQRAPGGSNAYNLCFHGLGHGVLAFKDYDFAAAVALCRQLPQVSPSGTERRECIGGVTMELVGGGFHDRTAWLRAQKRFYRRDDPRAPCDGPWVDSEYRSICYAYLTPHLMEAAGAHPPVRTPEQFAKAFRFCEPIAVSARRDRDACFGGFGKEFVVIAHHFDIRTVESMPNDELSEIADWCGLARPQDGQDACIRVAIQSLYWGGENKPDAAIRLCALMSAHQRSICFSHLIDAALRFKKDSPQALDAFCRALPKGPGDSCGERARRASVTAG